MDFDPNQNPYASPAVSPVDHAPDDPAKVLQDPAELPQPHIGWALLSIVGFFVFQTVVGIGIAVIGIALWGVRVFQERESMEAFTQVIVMASSICTCVYAVALIAFVHRGMSGLRMAWRVPSVWQIALVVLAFLPLGIVVSELNNWLIPYVPSLSGDTMFKLSQMPLPIIVIAMCLLPAIGEELLFRGFIGRGLVGRYGPVVGVLLTSVIFGAVHIEPLQAISAAFLGVALHFIYLTTNSIFAPMLLHFLNNLFALIAMRYADELPLAGISIVGEGGQVIHTPVAVVLAATALAAIAMVMFYQSRSQWQTDSGQPWRFPYVTAESPADYHIHAHDRQPNLFLFATAVALFAGLVWLLERSMQQWVA